MHGNRRIPLITQLTTNLQTVHFFIYIWIVESCMFEMLKLVQGGTSLTLVQVNAWHVWMSAGAFTGSEGQCSRQTGSQSTWWGILHILLVSLWDFCSLCEISHHSTPCYSSVGSLASIWWDLGPIGVQSTGLCSLWDRYQRHILIARGTRMCHNHGTVWITPLPHCFKKS